MGLGPQVLSLPAIPLTGCTEQFVCNSCHVHQGEPSTVAATEEPQDCGRPLRSLPRPEPGYLEKGRLFGPETADPIPGSTCPFLIQVLGSQPC